MRRRIGSRNSIFAGLASDFSKMSRVVLGCSSDLARYAQFCVMLRMRFARRTSRTGPYVSVRIGYVMRAMESEAIEVTYEILYTCKEVIQGVIQTSCLPSPPKRAMDNQ